MTTIIAAQNTYGEEASEVLPRIALRERISFAELYAVSDIIKTFQIDLKGMPTALRLSHISSYKRPRG